MEAHIRNKCRNDDMLSETDIRVATQGEKGRYRYECSGGHMQTQTRVQIAKQVDKIGKYIWGGGVQDQIKMSQ